MVPRVAGGEVGFRVARPFPNEYSLSQITPDKLIVLGQVANKCESSDHVYYLWFIVIGR